MKLWGGRFSKETDTLANDFQSSIHFDQRLYRVRLNDPAAIKLDCPVDVDGVRYACSYVELGNPGLPMFFEKCLFKLFGNF